MTIVRALLLSVVAAGALVLPLAEQVGFEQVWEVSEVEDGVELEDDVNDPLWIELQLVGAAPQATMAADLEPADFEREGVRTSLERPPRH